MRTVIQTKGAYIIKAAETRPPRRLRERSAKAAKPSAHDRQSALMMLQYKRLA